MVLLENKKIGIFLEIVPENPVLQKGMKGRLDVVIFESMEDF